MPFGEGKAKPCMTSDNIPIRRNNKNATSVWMIASFVAQYFAVQKVKSDSDLQDVQSNPDLQNWILIAIPIFLLFQMLAGLQ